jgi:hypothetical protein
LGNEVTRATHRLLLFHDALSANGIDYPTSSLPHYCSCLFLNRQYFHLSKRAGPPRCILSRSS